MDYAHVTAGSHTEAGFGSRQRLDTLLTALQTAMWLDEAGAYLKKNWDGQRTRLFHGGSSLRRPLVYQTRPHSTEQC